MRHNLAHYTFNVFPKRYVKFIIKIQLRLLMGINFIYCFWLLLSLSWLMLFFSAFSCYCSSWLTLCVIHKHSFYNNNNTMNFYLKKKLYITYTPHTVSLSLSLPLHFSSSLQIFFLYSTGETLIIITNQSQYSCNVMCWSLLIVLVIEVF